MINSFTAYRDYHELITILSEKEQKELICAIWYYMFEGIEPKLNKNQMKIFNNLKRPLDKSKNKSKNGSISKSNENQNIEQIDNQNEIKTKSNENQNNNKNKSHQDVNVIVNVNVFNYYENNIGTITSIVYEKLNNWCKYFTEDIIKYAIDISCENNARTMRYIDTILSSWKNAGYKVLADCRKSRKTNTPEWMGKDIKEEKLNEQEQKQMENLLMEFK